MPIRFPSTAECYPFTHATVEGEPLFWHVGGAAWVRGEAGWAEMALWLWFMGADQMAVRILEARAEKERNGDLRVSS